MEGEQALAQARHAYGRHRDVEGFFTLGSCCHPGNTGLLRADIAANVQHKARRSRIDHSPPHFNITMFGSYQNGNAAFPTVCGRSTSGSVATPSGISVL